MSEIHTMPDTKPTIPEEAVETAKDVLLALRPFFELDHAVLPAAYIRAFLLVAGKEGLTVSEYANLAGISPTVMTRNLLDIGELNRQRAPGLGLIEQVRDSFDLRKHRARLTPKGRKLALELNATLRLLGRTK